MHVRAVLAGVVAVLLPGHASAQCAEAGGAAADLVREGDAVAAVNLDDAISRYQRAADLAPDDERIWWKVALLEQKREDWQRMALACEKAEAVAERRDHGRTRADYHFRHGYALEQMADKGEARWQDARAQLETAVQIDPGYGQAWGELGYVLLHLDDEAGALQSWTRAILRSPEDVQYYVMLADLYQRLLLFPQAEQVLAQGLSFAREGDRHVFALHALLGSIRESRRDIPGAVAEYEAAKTSCQSTHCVEHRDAAFNLGAANAELTPPRKNEAMQQLQVFWKSTCKGALAARYADQCSEAQEIVRRLGGSRQ